MAERLTPAAIGRSQGIVILRTTSLILFAFATVATVLGDSSLITYPAAAEGAGNGRHLVFLTGDEEYRSEEGLPMLAKLLSQRYGFRCTVLFALDPDGTVNPNNNRSVSGIEALDTADGIVLQLRFRRWPDEAMRHFEQAVERGVPLVALRTSTHAFRFLPDDQTSFAQYNHFGRRVLGEDWVSHWGANRKGATRGIVEPGAEHEPILRGVTDVFGDSGIYETHPTPDSKILMRGLVLKGMNPSDESASYRKARKSDGVEQDVNNPAMPIAWIRTNINPSGTTNRVFCTTMGAASDLKNEGLRRMVVNATLWGFDLEIPAKADVRFVDPYSPTDYSFEGFRRGIRPADHALGIPLKPGSAAQPRPSSRTDSEVK